MDLVKDIENQIKEIKKHMRHRPRLIWYSTCQAWTMTHVF